MHYVIIPAPVALVDPIDGGPLLAPPHACSFARAVRIALAWLLGKGETDVLEVHDLRAKIERANVGDEVELSESEWGMLEPVFRKPTPQVFGHPWIFAAESHQRAWLEASTRCRLPKAASNGSAEVSGAS